MPTISYTPLHVDFVSNIYKFLSHAFVRIKLSQAVKITTVLQD